MPVHVLVETTQPATTGPLHWALMTLGRLVRDIVCECVTITYDDTLCCIAQVQLCCKLAGSASFVTT